jgi:hypothetical protein
VRATRLRHAPIDPVCHMAEVGYRPPKAEESGKKP